jgi:hypothetical protein
MSGEAHYPSSSTRSFELYQKERFQRSQEANWGPGPQRGANEVSDDDDLPEPTHSPVARTGWRSTTDHHILFLIESS